MESKELLKLVLEVEDFKVNPQDVQLGANIILGEKGGGEGDNLKSFVIDVFQDELRMLNLVFAVDEFKKNADTTYFENILKENNVILPSKENLIINFEELKAYCYRIIDKGFYKRKDYEIRAIQKILGITNIVENNLAIKLNKEVLNQDFSVRYAMIIESLRQTGSKKEPVIIENASTGAVVRKIGGACDEQDLVLFDFLLGQFMESNQGILQLIKREDLLDSLNMDRNKKRVDKMMLSLSNLASQVVLLDDDNAKDRVKKALLKDKSIQKNASRLKLKGINLFTFEAVELDGELTVQFKIPLVRYLGVSNQFGRYIDANIMKHWSKKPRVYWIAKELAKLCRMNESNSRKSISEKLSVEKLLKNINEWDKYKSYQNKRVFLNRLFEDITLANKYLKSDNISFVPCTPTTLKTGRLCYKK